MNTRIITRTLGTLAIAAALSLTVTSSADAGRRPHRGGIYHHRGVPEINPAAVGSVVSVLVGGLAIFADRRRKR